MAKRIIHIVGNRPQFIKLSLLHRSLSGSAQQQIIHTGQHFSENMSAIFFREFDIPPPDHQLEIHSMPHGEMIGHMLIGLDRWLAQERPDAVVVYGDTNTTLAGSLAARKRNIPLMHIEAGIRTGEEDMPEESNRYLSDRMADLNFACTYLGVDNLLKEGMQPEKVYNTGDLMLDAAMLFSQRAKDTSAIVSQSVPSGQPFVLATIHRAENTDNPTTLAAILQALHHIHTDIPVVFPVHPRTRQVIDANGMELKLITTPPLGYLDMLALVQTAGYVVTDSGGLSREAFFFQKPSVIVMKQMFWPEISMHGPSLKAVAESDAILAAFRALQAPVRSFDTSVFGDGHAAEKISRLILNHLHG